MVFDYFYDVYLFEIQHVCKLNWTKRPSEVLSFSMPMPLNGTECTPLLLPSNVNVKDLQTALDAM
jgi:hypothetical protein